VKSVSTLDAMARSLGGNVAQRRTRFFVVICLIYHFAYEPQTSDYKCRVMRVLTCGGLASVRLIPREHIGACVLPIMGPSWAAVLQKYEISISPMVSILD
jgi:hypothetical protein